MLSAVKSVSFTNSSDEIANELKERLDRHPSLQFLIRLKDEGAKVIMPKRYYHSDSELSPRESRDSDGCR